MTKEAKRARRVYLRLFILLKGNATLTPLSARACPSTGSSLKQLRAMYARHCELEGWPGAVSNNDCHLRRILVD